MESDADFHALAARLEARFLEDGPDPWSDAEVEAWAHRIFAHQFEACAPYRAFCTSRGVTPDNVAAWEEIPAVPATAFKHFDFVSAPTPAEVVFRTSGTTRGEETRGRHHVPRLGLYRASLREPFRRALLPDVDPGGVCFLSLIPRPEDASHSSLSFMVGSAARQLEAPVEWLVDGEGRWREGAVDRASERVEAAPDAPVLLLGTALSFVHLLSDAVPGPLRRLVADLPEGSRIMETGGFKGAERSVSRTELYDGLQALTRVPRGRMVNEYGMTELLSQLYEPVLVEGERAAGVHVPAPWLRVRALDPVTLRPVDEGQEGILAFFDPANLGSIAHVLTEDVGSVTDGRVRLRGRAAGAEPRGCSRAMDELMEAAARG